MLKVEVDRRTWLRGEGSRDSFLLRRSDGKMCCLGSVALALGYTQDQIRGYTTPSALTDVTKFVDTGFVFKESTEAGPAPTQTCHDMMKDNDSQNPSYKDSEREEDLTRFAKKLGIELVFIN